MARKPPGGDPFDLGDRVVDVGEGDGGRRSEAREKWGENRSTM